MASVYIGGVEGGATHSKFVICNEEGDIVALVKGLGTNHWMVGIKECARRIAEMVETAKLNANIPETTRLAVLGLCLSGCEQEATNKVLEDELRTEFPNVADKYVVCSDTVGSIYTASSLGGMVLISGTGSNALLRNPDGSTYGCGGWGHMIGDEGGAWWISKSAIKTIFDDQDNFVPSTYDTTRVWELIKEHFSVETRSDLLDHCYAKFCKSFYSGLCIKLAQCAAEEKDELCLHFFEEAGRVLARSVCALAPKINPDLIKCGELDIVCVGSVWSSWDLLKPGFIKALNTNNFKYEVKLVKLKQTMALGAAYLAADSNQISLSRDYSKNYEVFYTHRPSAVVNGSKN